MKNNWRMRAKKVDFDAYAQQLGVSPVMVRLLCNRELNTIEQMRRFLYGTIDELHSPYLLKDAQKAMEILYCQIGKGKKIRVIGDYDVDGVTSAYLFKKGMQQMGAQVSIDIPERIRDGYGLNERIIQKAVHDQVEVLVTCDNGIAAKNEIALAKKSGMTVIVTDHHEVPYAEDENGRREILPDADAIVNPKQAEDEYPCKDICGAFVAMKCVQILFDLAKKDGKVQEDLAGRVMEEIIEFAALGTVCDVMPLCDENRILVKEGLRLMEKSHNMGLRTLLQEKELSEKRLSAYHLGFEIGPCINAMGRLETAKKALELFEATDEDEAIRLARHLVDTNEERKEMTQKGVEEAMHQVDTQWADDKILVVYLENTHESLAGIIAGRVREAYQKPCMVVTKSADGLKGSGRSMEAYHMRDGLQGVQDLLTKFGGHKLAAGFSLPKENLEEFRRRLNEQTTLTEEDFVRDIMLDMDLPIAMATMQLTQELEMLQPYGTGNEAPLFGRSDCTLEQMRIVGQNNRVVKCRMKSPGGKMADAIYFGDAKQFVEEVEKKHSKILLAYYPNINEFRGEKSVQLVIKYYEIIE